MIEDDVEYILKVIDENPSMKEAVIERILNDTYDRGYEDGITKFAEGLRDGNTNVCQDDGR